MWQRLRLDVPASVDFTQNKPGEVVFTEAATVELCPGCGMPAVREPTPLGFAYIHKRLYPRGTVEACLAAPDDSPELKVWDADGKLVYEGPLPQADKVN